MRKFLMEKDLLDSKFTQTFNESQVFRVILYTKMSRLKTGVLLEKYFMATLKLEFF